MWRRSPKTAAASEQDSAPPPLKVAVREARIEAAERTGVVVDLRDADVARLEILNEALDPVFAEIPADIDLFDRGISRGDTPRLWLDAVAHVMMGHDKRTYRLVHDTSYGRRVLASPQLVESGPDPREERRRARRKMVAAFLVGVIIGIVILFMIAWNLAPNPY